MRDKGGGGRGLREDEVLIFVVWGVACGLDKFFWDSGSGSKEGFGVEREVGFLGGGGEVW